MSMLEVRTDGTGVTVVTVLMERILDYSDIEALGKELFALVDEEKREKILINFWRVSFMSSAVFQKLIILDKKVLNLQGHLALCGICPEVYEVFVITRLHRLFEIRDTEDEGIKFLSSK